MKARRLAFIFAAISFVAVIAMTRAVSHFALSLNGMTILPGFADFRFMSNRGVSFSLFAQNSELGAHLLTGCLAAIVVGFCIWAYRTTSRLAGIALGTIIGGGLYNVVDRALHERVFDFLVLRVGSFPLFVCNAADIAISIGVILLLLHFIRETRSGTLPS